MALLDMLIGILYRLMSIGGFVILIIVIAYLIAISIQVFKIEYMKLEEEIKERKRRQEDE